MTNTGDTLTHFDRVAALVLVETSRFYTGEITPALNAGINDGFLRVWRSAGVNYVALSLTDAGRDRLAGFRRLLATNDD